MAIGSLILGILGLVLFCWLGPLLGAGWAGIIAGTSAIDGEVVITAWPVWVLGLGIGAGIPLVAVFLGIGGMKSDMKGVAIAGMVMGVIDIIAAFVLTGVFVAGLSLANEVNNADFDETFKQLQEQLDDTDMQQQLQEQLQRAADQIETPPPAEAPPAE